MARGNLREDVGLGVSGGERHLDEFLGRSVMPRVYEALELCLLFRCKRDGHGSRIRLAPSVVNLSMVALNTTENRIASRAIQVASMAWLVLVPYIALPFVEGSLWTPRG